MRARDLVAVVESCYQTDRGLRAWLDQVHATLGSTLDSGLGSFAVVYDASSPTLRVLDMRARSPAVPLEEMRRALATLSPDYVDRSFRALPCGLASEVPGYQDQPNQNGLLRRRGVRDMIAVNARDTSGLGVCIEAFRARRPRLTDAARSTYSRLAAHVSAGFRLQDVATAERAPEAVLSPDGRMLHALGAARLAEAREALSEAVRSIDVARGAMRRSDPEGAVARWRALALGRWSLVDEFERDGKHFVVAKANEPFAPRARGLAPRERQVLALAAQGHHNKLIAYELGLSASTVRVLLVRSARKLGTRTRAQTVSAYAKLSAPRDATARKTR